MFKSRSGGRGRGRESASSLQKVPLKGLFSDGVWHCNCEPRLPAERFQTNNGGKNHGRWFYTCQNAQPKRCNFFLWDDEAKPREACAVLSNSRTEQSPQTPNRHPSSVYLTPQTPYSRQRPISPETPTPHTPSKPSSVQILSPPQQSTSEEPFDWPASDDEELSKVADRISNPPMPPPQTPRKVQKTNTLSTPGKRRFSAIDDDSNIPTPSTPTTGAAPDIFTTPSTNSQALNLFCLPSPAETPTPNRFTNIPPMATGQDSDLATQIIRLLNSTHQHLNASTTTAIKEICHKHALFTQGVIKGRDISRSLIKKKTETITELHEKIAVLQAQWETSRAVIRHLRREVEIRRGGER
ncbi:hypothetical protein MMC12_004542 [Toensbergia leucococca]|nr:hypothetical protein [Toensbergia leucococca]